MHQVANKIQKWSKQQQLQKIKKRPKAEVVQEAQPKREETWTDAVDAVRRASLFVRKQLSIRDDQSSSNDTQTTNNQEPQSEGSWLSARLSSLILPDDPQHNATQMPAIRGSDDNTDNHLTSAPTETETTSWFS